MGDQRIAESVGPTPRKDVAVVGGAYYETCLEPELERLMGSGLRAACLLSSLGHHTVLSTCIDDTTRQELQSVAAGAGVGLDARSRDGRVDFRYDTPLHAPTFDTGTTREAIEVDADAVLGFGMLEGVWRARARSLVLDPQHCSVEEQLGSCRADRIALILNEHEARAAGGTPSVEDAARRLLAYGVDAVVVKRGALGGLLAREEELEFFGAVPTEQVSPLGSGDAFSAGFSHAWQMERADPFEAVTFASRIAACHSTTGVAQVDNSVLSGLPDLLPYPSAPPKVYLAGPFFSVGERAMIRFVRSALHHVGADVFSPMHDVGRGGDDVAVQDMRGLMQCDSVLALLDGGDPGTLVEVGWALRAGIPVVGLADEAGDHAWTMIRGLDAEVTSDMSAAVYHAVWAGIAHGASHE